MPSAIPNSHFSTVYVLYIDLSCHSPVNGDQSTAVVFDVPTGFVCIKKRQTDILALPNSHKPEKTTADLHTHERLSVIIGRHYVVVVLCVVSGTTNNISMELPGRNGVKNTIRWTF